MKVEEGVLAEETQSVEACAESVLAPIIARYFSHNILKPGETLHHELTVTRVYDEEGGVRLWVTIGVLESPNTFWTEPTDN